MELEAPSDEGTQKVECDCRDNSGFTGVFSTVDFQGRYRAESRVMPGRRG